MTPSQAQLDLGMPDDVPVAVTMGAELPDGLTGLLVAGKEPRGVVYTRPWVADLILDLAGYRPTADLAARHAVEPAAGEGAFLVPMVRRLLASLTAHGRELSDAREAIHAYELDADSAARAVQLVARELREHGASAAESRELAEGWVSAGDYLLASPRDKRADLVVGNPPYIRYDDFPDGTLQAYRRLYPAMVGRCDIYVGFIEAGLRQLKDGGVLAFICADRWMRSAYGAELRRMITSAFAVETVIEMHDAPAFEDEVAAYPAVIAIRRGPQGRAIIASAGNGAGPLQDDASLADAVAGLAQGRVMAVPGFTATTVDRWFRGSTPWPSLQPGQLRLLQRLEAHFGPLEDPLTGTKVGIGVATGADRVFITTDTGLVEPDRLVPLAMTADTRQGDLRWSGHFLVDPWMKGGGLVDLATYPRLHAYFQGRRDELEGRNIVKRNARDWYRTIDRVHHDLTTQPKLYFPDMKLTSNPVLDSGGTYPHHNLYFLTSQVWDLEVLGGLLFSRVAQLFIEAYCAKMRGGTLRFQAQYLRRIRVPAPDALPEDLNERLRQAFRSRNVDAATDAAVEAYGITDLSGALSC
jgi:adenine-specific DNA-methyltransferase